MSDLRVSIEELVDASVCASNIADDVDQGLKSFAGEVRALLSEWSGLSATAFDESWTEWAEGACRVVEGLRASAALLSQTASEFGEQEHANTEALGRVARDIR